MTDRTIYALFRDSLDAETAANEMGLLGIKARDISILMSDPRMKTEATSATALGALGGLLASTVVPGLGDLLVGGPVAATLGITTVATTTLADTPITASSGGLFAALVTLGVPQTNATKYEESIARGNVLLAIPASEEVEYQILDILEELGAYDVHSIRTSDIPQPDQDHYEYRLVDSPSGGRPAYATLGSKGGSKSSDQKTEEDGSEDTLQKIEDDLKDIVNRLRKFNEG